MFREDLEIYQNMQNEDQGNRNSDNFNNLKTLSINFDTI